MVHGSEEEDRELGWDQMMSSESLDPKLQFALDSISSLHLISSHLMQASLLITKLGSTSDHELEVERIGQ
jgi:hypothetical protein